jgi:hypothetical protein
MMYWMLVPILLFLSGCAEAPLPKFMAQEAAASIQIGRSTMTDVKEAFGPPQTVRTVQEKDSTVTFWWYQYVEWRTGNRTIVGVQFGPNQVVQKIERTYEEIRSPEERGIPARFY